MTADPDRLAEIARYCAPIGEAFAHRLADYDDDALRAVLRYMLDSHEVSEAEIDRIRGTGTPHASRSR